ncbi:MAG: hypothetical protein LBP75_06620, partial [Planctomycetota bacterium]|jgi:hypothetical protein|nr:hypothetical protein [Planctomycetota bacterium]
VAVVMIATALLGTARRHTDTARAVKHADILQLALFSAKAANSYEISHPAADSPLKRAYNTITGTSFIYDVDVAAADGSPKNIKATEFAAIINPSDPYEFYRHGKTAQEFNRALQFTGGGGSALCGKDAVVCGAVGRGVFVGLCA